VLGSWPRKVQTQSSSLQSMKNWRLKSKYTVWVFRAASEKEVISVQNSG
jgi:hypothetical protein